MRLHKRKGQFYIIGAIILSFFFYSFINELIISDSILSTPDLTTSKVKKLDEIFEEINKTNEDYLNSHLSIIEHATFIKQYLEHIKKFYGIKNAYSSYSCLNNICNISIEIKDQDVKVRVDYTNLPYNP